MVPVARQVATRRLGATVAALRPRVGLYDVEKLDAADQRAKICLGEQEVSKRIRVLQRRPAGALLR